MAVKRVKPFQLKAAGGKPYILEIGPKYNRPQDDTTILSVFQRTTGGGGSFLLERPQFTGLAAWLSGDRAQPFELKDRSHYLTLFTDGRLLHIGTGWLSASGGKVSLYLDAPETHRLTAWAVERDAFGWEGWKSGCPVEMRDQWHQRVEPTAHNGWTTRWCVNCSDDCEGAGSDRCDCCLKAER